jgi:NAD(P)-dependent dehydrogenase (short-subunit alcohol dehydrogenase family)
VSDAVAERSPGVGATLAEVRRRESDGFVVQADISRPEDVRGLFQQVEDRFGRLDIFVSNARPELPTLYQPPLALSLDSWRIALDSQATAFLVGAQDASRLMRAGGRILAITYAPSTRTGSWQPWIGMGSAKAALEALVRYFAVALASQEITVNAVSPGLTEDSVLNGLPQEVQSASHEWHEGGWMPMGRMGTPADIGNAVALLATAWLGHRMPNAL